MSVEIKPIEATKSQLKKFIKFGIDHYRGNDCYVPPLIMDDVATLSPDENPAFDFCRALSFMAYRDGKPVGRITGIINDVVNERTGNKQLRFGFVEFIDDDEVVDALFDAVSDWGRRLGMTEIVGPLGFTDMDHEGMLVEGFDQLGTMATIYNYPYYPRQLERRGMVKDVDWVEYLIPIPDSIPDKHKRIGEIVKKKFNLSIARVKSRKELKERYGKQLFALINKAYDRLYGYSPLTPRQIDYYIKQYLGLIKLENLCIIVDADDHLVGCGISVSSFSRALQKSRGRLFPLGWRHMLKPLFGHVDTVDLLLVAIDPDYQGKGVNALLFTELIPAFQRLGYKQAESNPELESNENVQKQWEYFERRQHKRRRSYKAPL
ncbi:MAG: N-acetyltransferase [Muribaculaceae bacterium]|nr:N-acetyltransferase [Muribaculaceae bacterium]